jgi:hypothetical protein
LGSAILAGRPSGPRSSAATIATRAQRSLRSGWRCARRSPGPPGRVRRRGPRSGDARLARRAPRLLCTLWNEGDGDALALEALILEQSDQLEGPRPFADCASGASLQLLDVGHNVVEARDPTEAESLLVTLYRASRRGRRRRRCGSARSRSCPPASENQANSRATNVPSVPVTANSAEAVVTPLKVASELPRHPAGSPAAGGERPPVPRELGRVTEPARRTPLVDRVRLDREVPRPRAGMG